MSQNRPIVVYHSFFGGRFDKHHMPLAALCELVHYQELVTDLSQELWRRKYPERERLPSNFDDSLQLDFSQIIGNCVKIPLSQAEWDPDHVVTMPVELTDSAHLIAETIDCAAQRRPLPDRFPRHLLGRFEQYGKSLRDDEWIEQSWDTGRATERFTQEVRRTLLELADKPYEASVDLVGKVTMARVSKAEMMIKTADNDEIKAEYSREDELTITSALRDHASVIVRVIGKGCFSADHRLLRIQQAKVVNVPGHPSDSTHEPTIWDDFADIVLDPVPPGSPQPPIDGAIRHDFYIDEDLRGQGT